MLVTGVSSSVVKNLFSLPKAQNLGLLVSRIITTTNPPSSLGSRAITFVGNHPVILVISFVALVVLLVKTIKFLRSPILISAPHVLEGDQRKREQAGLLSNALRLALGENRLGYYRNSAHVIPNLAIALRVYSETGDLNARFESTSSRAQGGSQQPESIIETFQNALRPDFHGGVVQTIAAIRSPAYGAPQAEDQPIADAAERAVTFIRERILVG